jgi:hypothetical protein
MKNGFAYPIIRLLPCESFEAFAPSALYSLRRNAHKTATSTSTIITELSEHEGMQIDYEWHCVGSGTDVFILYCMTTNGSKDLSIPSSVIWLPVT